MGGVEGGHNLTQLRRKISEGNRPIRIDIDGEAKVIQLHSGSHLAFLPIAQIEMSEPFADPSFKALLRIAEIPLCLLMPRVQSEGFPKAAQRLDIVLRLVIADAMVERQTGLSLFEERAGGIIPGGESTNPA
jgi:hypothetical protein